MRNIQEAPRPADGTNSEEVEMSGLVMKYFVLKPAGDDHYARASRKAMRAYADYIRTENREMSDELLRWADAEMTAMLERNPTFLPDLPK